MGWMSGTLLDLLIDVHASTRCMSCRDSTALISQASAVQDIELTEQAQV